MLKDEIRSISSLLNPAPKKDQVLNIKLEDIIPDPNQPRKTFDEKSLQELTESIQEHGVLQPIGLLDENERGQFIIVFGERRYRAACAVEGMDSIPALLVESIDSVTQMVENIQRNDLTPMEIGQWIQSKIAEGETSTSIAKRLNKPKDYVSLYKSFSTMPDYLQSLYDRKLCMSVKSLVSLQRHAKENEAKVKRFCEQVNEPVSRNTITDFIGEKSEPQDDLSSKHVQVPRPILKQAKVKKGIKVKIDSSEKIGYLNLKQGIIDGQVSVVIDGQTKLYPVSELRIEDIVT